MTLQPHAFLHPAADADRPEAAAQQLWLGLQPYRLCDDNIDLMIERSFRQQVAAKDDSWGAPITHTLDYTLQQIQL